MSESLALGALLREWTRHLSDSGSDSARLDVEVLVCDALSVNRAWLVAHADETLSVESLAAVQTRLQRRLTGEPVAYITGHREFWSLCLAVDHATLVPRADTELLVESAIALLPLGHLCRVADLGTGSGAVAVAIACERPLASLVATDASEAALAVAQRNIARHADGRVTLLHGDWWSPLAGQRFDVVVSNPPYVAAGDPHLERGDLRHEPRAALVAGADGLVDIRRIIAGAREHLLPDGWLLLEHGADQADAVCEQLTGAGFSHVSTRADLAGRARVSGGQSCS